MTTTTDTIESEPAASADGATTEWWRPLCGKVGFRARRRLQPLGRERLYVPSSTIVAEGDRADRFVLIVEGEVQVVVNDEIVATLREGDYFGEVAMLYSRPRRPLAAPVALRRTATVKTTTSTLTREFDRAELMTLLDAAPLAATKISRRAVGRLGAITALGLDT